MVTKAPDSIRAAPHEPWWRAFLRQFQDLLATIVPEVSEGRGGYANIVNFTRFQVFTALGFVMTFRAAVKPAQPARRGRAGAVRA